MNLPLRLSAFLGEAVASIMRATGIALLLRNTVAKRKATIILYHNPTVDVLDSHLKYLSKRYHFIALDVLVTAIRSRNWSSVPPKSMVLTIDDGHRGNYDLLGVFRKYNIRPTIYVCSQLVNTDRHFWWQIRGLDHRPLKELPNDERLRYLSENYGYTPVKEYPVETRQALNHEEMNEMKSTVDFQSHSRFHPMLTSCGYDESAMEIGGSRNELEVLLESGCSHFSFPNGFYTERELNLAREAGYLSCRTTDLGWNGINADPYRLKAMGITDTASVNVLSLQACGIPAYLKGVLRGNFSGKWIARKNSPTGQK